MARGTPTVVDNLFKKGWLCRDPGGPRLPEYASRVPGRGLMRGALDAAGDPDGTLTNFVEHLTRGDRHPARRPLLVSMASAAAEGRHAELTA